MSITVDPAAFYAAGRTVGISSAQAGDTVSALVAELADSAAMAGSDPGGQAWAAGYDLSARTVLAASAALAPAFDHLAYLLERSGANYAAAEHSSTGGISPTEPTPPAGFRGTAFGPINDLPVMAGAPSAAGGSSAGPPGWHFIAAHVGQVWPNGHQDKLRAAATAWAVASSRLNDAQATGVYPQFVGIACPERPAVLQTTADLDRHVVDLSQACSAIAQACGDYAEHLDQAHHQVIHELEVLLAENAAMSGAGALLTIVSAGLSDVAAAAAVSVRCAVVAARVGGILERLVAAAVRIGHQVAAVATRIDEISHSIRAFLEIRIATAAVRAVPRLAKVTWAEKRVGRVAGLSERAARNAFIDMRGGGGHAMQHLIDEGMVPKVGSLEKRRVRFEEIIRPVLRSPISKYKWRLRNTPTTAFTGVVDDRQLVVFVGREGKWKGKVLSAVMRDLNRSPDRVVK